MGRCFVLHGMAEGGHDLFRLSWGKYGLNVFCRLCYLGLYLDSMMRISIVYIAYLLWLLLFMLNLLWFLGE